MVVLDMGMDPDTTKTHFINEETKTWRKRKKKKNKDFPQDHAHIQLQNKDEKSGL